MNSRNNILQEIESEIKKMKDFFNDEKDNNKLEEKVLEILCEIEEKVSEIIGNRKMRTSQEKEKVFQRYISINHVKSEYTSIDDFLDMLIDKLYAEVSKNKIQLNYDIFEVGKSKIEGIGNGKEKKELQVVQKVKILQKVLYKMQYDVSNIQQYEEKINPERMREIPYQIFHLQSENNKKTVLICNEIGQATFVYEGIINPSVFQYVEKGEAIDGVKPLKIIYRKNTFEKNIEIALSNTITFDEKEENIVNGKEEKIEEELTKTQLFGILWSYKRTEQESYDYFMGLKQGNKDTLDSIKGFKIQGKGVIQLKTISGLEVELNILTSSGFQEWIEKVFEGKDIERKEEELTKPKLFAILWNYKGTEQESYNYFMGLKVGNKDTSDSINGLKIQGKGVIQLRIISGLELEGNIKIPSGFQEWIEKVFECKDIERKEELTKPQLFSILLSYKGTEQESYDYFMGLKQGNKDTPDSINGFKIQGKGLRQLRTISGLELDGEILSPSGFQEWIKKVFDGKDIERKY